MIQKAILYGDEGKDMYHLYAYVIMPNHIHVLWLPHVKHSLILDWLKGVTARRANRMLCRTREPFWQDEVYDHWVRDREEMGKIVRYIEFNPVKAGLVERVEAWPWSSAWQPPKNERLLHSF